MKRRKVIEFICCAIVGVCCYGILRKILPIEIYYDGKAYKINPNTYTSADKMFDDLIDVIMDFAKKNDLNEDDIIMAGKTLAKDGPDYFMCIELDDAFLYVNYETEFRTLEITLHDLKE